MEKYEIGILLDALKQKRIAPAKELEQIDALISKYEKQFKQLDSTPTANELFTLRLTESPEPQVYLTSTLLIHEKILELLEVIKVPLKTQEIAAQIQTDNSNGLSIGDILRKLHKANKVKMMKVNNSNKLTYWIKSDWYDEEKKAVKSGYRTDGIDYYEGVDKIEYL
jgi:hypothetical protein